MTGNEYQKLAMRTNDGESTYRICAAFASHDAEYDMGGIVMATMGLSGEVGELTDMIKKWIFHDSGMDITHAKKELGDIMWYIACMAESFGWSLDEIMQLNVDKLKARYPDGFNVERANHRTEGDV
ncbi:MAG: nucleoside triphosphate pyrophosphohydrolase family protein [Firmicutes bacterium]|nr:nucleoside triphosphate pyrophosphohydrolase family protein [Bacillota bacterium]